MSATRAGISLCGKATGLKNECGGVLGVSRFGLAVRR